MRRPKISLKVLQAPARSSKPKRKAPKRGAEPLPSLKAFELLSGVFQDGVGRAFARFLNWMRDEEKNSDTKRGLRLYRKLWKAVVESEELLKRPGVGDGLQDHLLDRFLDDPNILHRKAELAPYSQMGLSLKLAYHDELENFLSLLRADWESLLKNHLGDPKSPSLPSLKHLSPLEAPESFPAVSRARLEMKRKILKASSGATALVPEICAHFFENGFGLFGHFRAFRWDASRKALEGVESPDPIRLENLVGYDEARAPLTENTEAFVSGKPANNVLIYGERGTGKSSTVKALLNAYEGKGLRLVEVSAQDLADYPFILRILRGRHEKFLLFVDDLSFEETETRYKGLKALLEGTVEATPPNVILVATSNRRHLVREFFAEREEGVRKEGEVHGQDTVEKKLSLSDRFGLVVSFYAPNQETYLKIVDQWAETLGLRLPKEELHSRAILWARRNNGPSGRTARQFINDLRGRL